MPFWGNMIGGDWLGPGVIPPAGEAGAWIEIGRTTLGVAGPNIDVIVPQIKRYYMVLIRSTGQSAANSNTDLSVGDSIGGFDSGTNYAFRRSNNGGADALVTNAVRLIGDTWNSNAGTNDPLFSVIYVDNNPRGEKIGIAHSMQRENQGAASAPERNEIVGKWTNQIASIDRFRAFITASNNFLAGSEMVVLGWDPEDTHVDSQNFWEELASVSATSGTNLLATFTPKKYLWVQVYGEMTDSSPTSGGWALRTGNGSTDSGTNYANRTSFGGGDSVLPNTTVIQFESGSANEVTFGEYFVVNEQNDDKLFIGHTHNIIFGGPFRGEMAAKWDNTSVQMDRIDLTRLGPSGAIIEANIKIWGHD